MIDIPKIEMFSYYNLTGDEEIYEVVGFEDNKVLVLGLSDFGEVSTEPDKLKLFWLQKGQVFKDNRKLISLSWDADAEVHTAFLEPGGLHLLSDLLKIELL